MKKIIKYPIITFIIILLIFAVIASCAFLEYKKKLRENPVENVDVKKVQDGVYTGWFDATLVNAKVEVTVQKGKIIDLKLLQHDHGKGYSGEAILAKVLNEQSLEVNMITGATASSQTILKAIEFALRKGLD
ncbi:MAG: FMN-binding protein [Candidatus Cloacimonetes bacterium]|nr:FMN-binding protein [Candidatus Cloacimonadota bacterium]MCF7812961.1 FMN-binding protein [Candidatus Cloacimonadota bacterium]MCF7867307.1 FMN-binding protein [Candidatus Cloacimonadota bacterium]MCF7882751.1 FMN-binding protein [Candidatus Cloacimonadota bacterium]